MTHFVLPRLPAHPAPPPALSVVVPVFNEQEVLAETHRRLRAACAATVGDDFEIVYVDDGSRDRTWAMLGEIAGTDANIVAVGLSRNFGHQLALSAGLELCRGERILMIDADLQDPPELLGAMMEKMDAGADIVYGQRTERRGETAFKRGTAAAFYRLLDRVTDVDIPQDTGDFRLVTRQVLEALKQLPESHRFVRGLFAWLGFRQVALPYVRHERFAGETKYPLRRMLRLAIDAITGFSTVPLRAALWLAIAGFVVALAVGLYAFGSWLFFDTVRGWASIVGVIALFASAQLLCLGILGEYIGRMFMQAKGRPLAIVREVVTAPRAGASE
jgi:glycosyltransferase involved in cell wall biosynthesis